MKLRIILVSLVLFAAPTWAQTVVLPKWAIVRPGGALGAFSLVDVADASQRAAVPANLLIEWKRPLVAVFAPERPGRARAALSSLVEPARPGDPSVIALEPGPSPDFRQRFYFLPILSVAAWQPRRISAHLLNVAALAKGAPPFPRNPHALELEPLGAAAGPGATMLTGWLADRNPDDPAQEAAEMRLLLGRDRLTALVQSSRAAIAAGERAQLDSRHFFSRLREVWADVHDNLPNRSSSVLASVDEQMWLAMGAPRQTEVRVHLVRHLEALERRLASPGEWVAFAEQTPEGGRLSAVPLAEIP